MAPEAAPARASRLDTLWARCHLVYFVASTLVGAVLAIASFPFSPSGDAVIFLARLWSRLLLATARVRVTVTFHAAGGALGAASGTLAPDRPYVFAANHASSVDIWALFVALPVNFRFIAKKQLGHIPLFGWAMAAGRFIFIDRQNPAAARRSIARAADRIRSGTSVAIFPEGTRTRDGTLGPFKKGGVHLAAEAGVPIVPIAIRGSRAIMPRGSFFLRRGTVHVDVGEPIATAGAHSPAERTALVGQIRDAIARMLAQ
jgi:1-acyl-sn-glycerol-3-phosphate acyltransferase